MSLRVLLLAAVGIALGEAAAIPTPTTSACPAYVTQVAQFDALPTGTAPPSAYKNANWSGFKVASKSYAGVKPHSGSNVLMSAALGAHLDNASDQIAITIKSLSFACVSFYPFNRYIPVQCDLHVFTETPTNAVQIIEHGPYKFSPNYTQTTPPSEPVYYMQNVTFDQSVYGSTIWFMLSNAPGYTQLVIDDVVIQAANSCPGS